MASANGAAPAEDRLAQFKAVCVHLVELIEWFGCFDSSITGTELCQVLSIDSKQLRQWLEEGLPQRYDGRFDGDEADDWLAEKKRALPNRKWKEERLARLETMAKGFDEAACEYLALSGDCLRVCDAASSVVELGGISAASHAELVWKLATSTGNWLRGGNPFDREPDARRQIFSIDVGHVRLNWARYQRRRPCFAIDPERLLCSIGKEFAIASKSTEQAWSPPMPPKEICRRLGLSWPTILKRNREGTIRLEKLSPKSYRVACGWLQI